MRRCIILLLCIVSLTGCSATLNSLIPATVVKDRYGYDVFCWYEDPYYHECVASAQNRVPPKAVTVPAVLLQYQIRAYSPYVIPVPVIPSK